MVNLSRLGFCDEVDFVQRTKPDELRRLRRLHCGFGDHQTHRFVQQNRQSQVFLKQIHEKFVRQLLAGRLPGLQTCLDAFLKTIGSKTIKTVFVIKVIKFVQQRILRLP